MVPNFSQLRALDLTGESRGSDAWKVGMNTTWNEYRVLIGVFTKENKIKKNKLKKLSFYG